MKRYFDEENFSKVTEKQYLDFCATTPDLLRNALSNAYPSDEWVLRLPSGSYKLMALKQIDLYKKEERFWIRND